MTGGGTRGIYQIGALKAIIELGLWDEVVSISACSIGTINAILIAQYDVNEAYKLWNELSTRTMFKNVNQYAPDYLLQFAKESLTEDGVDFNPFLELLDGFVDEEKVRNNPKETIITAYNQSTNKQEYYNLKDIPEGQLVQYAAASSRLPFFKPVFINGQKYVDGGIGDNHPYYSKLEDKHFDIVIMIKIGMIPFFIPNKRKSNITFNKEYVIKPSGKIGSPLEFKNPSFKKKYLMGYQDAQQVLMHI